MRWQLGITAGAIIFAICATAGASGYTAKVIYGDDNRLDYYQVPDAAWQTRAQATFALIRATSLADNGAGSTHITTVSYGQSMGLCTDEPFYSQETAAFCSGFLLTPNTVVTAGHCIRTQESCESIKFVLGFRLEAEGAQPHDVPTDMVYSCATLVHSVSIPDGEDFSVVTLDRPVTQVAPLAYRSAGDAVVGDPLTVMGHPVGLPLKIAGGANVRAVMPQFLQANLDTYGGNSGSAVLNSVTGDVEGVLVRGETDFVYKNGCRTSNRCDNAGCRGEDVTLIKQVLPYLPAPAL